MKNKYLILIIALVLILASVAAFIFLTSEQPQESYSDVATEKNHSDIWKTSNSIISRENKGTLFSRGESEKWFYLFLNPSGSGSNYIHKTPFTVEFDILNETYRCKIEFRDENNNASDIEFNTIHGRGVGHWKIIVNETNQLYYHDGELVKTDNQTFSGNIRVGFVGIYKENATDNSTLKFANFTLN